MAERRRMSNRDMQIRLYHTGLSHLLTTNKPFKQLVWTLLVNSGMFAPSPRQGSHADASYQLGRHSLGAELLSILRNAEPQVLSLLEAQSLVTAVEMAPEDETAPNPEDPYANPDDDP